MTCNSISKAFGYIAACGVLALGLATAPQAGAVPVSVSAETSGGLAGHEDGSPIDLLTFSGTSFSSSFTSTDASTQDRFKFKFVNNTGSNIVLSVVRATINQSEDLYFNDGVYVSYGDQDNYFVGEGVFEKFDLTALVKPGEIIKLAFLFGSAVGNSVEGGISGPDIDFNLKASVIPLPAGLVLFLSGLAGIGFLGRYKAKRRETAVA